VWKVYARDNGMAASVITGVYGFQTPIQFNCTSNNCTFPDFTSLGVCSECEDVTASTVETCNSTGFEHSCYYQLPNGAILSGSASFDAHNGFTHTQVNTTVVTTDSYSFKTLNLTQHGVPIIYLGLVRFPYSGCDGWAPPQDPPYFKTPNVLDTKLAKPTKGVFKSRFPLRPLALA
jgi:hypothetical protein